jgi:hypothetical protein
MGKILISYNNNVEVLNNQALLNNQPIEIEPGLNEIETAYRKAREIYRTLLTSNFENFIILTGAGSSIGIGTDGKVGMTMKGLWYRIEDIIGRAELKEFCNSLKFDYPEDGIHGDLEALLSKAVIAREFLSHDIEPMITGIQDYIRKACTLTLPDDSPHELFLKKITARKLKYPRVKLFTTNYDTLFEQAAGKCGHIVIDGFSYSFPRTFNGSNFDYDIVIREKSRIKNEENYTPRVFHLYKPHGSVDWDREHGRIIKAEHPVEPVMIYPKSTKYESSYEQPFFEMIARFQQALRNENVFLLSIGFSFYDKHISSIIHEALEVNPSFTLMVVTLGIEENSALTKLKKIASTQNNVILIEEKFEDFAREYPFNEIYREREESKYAD